jgi:dihydroneopterin aldolase
MEALRAACHLGFDLLIIRFGIGVVRAIVEGSSRDLIEALAGVIATAILAATPPEIVEAVEVRVRKPEAPIDGSFDTVEVAILRRRDGAGG